MAKWYGFAVLLATACAAPAQTSQGNFRVGAQLATFHSEVDNSTQQYALYVPKAFSAGDGKKYPLVISLHEEDSNHRLDLRRVFGVVTRFGEADTPDMRYFPPVRDVEYFVACPAARGTMGYEGVAERDVYDVLADVKRHFPIDEDRVYLTGVSMGGGGALRLALTRPDVWAAVAPLGPRADAEMNELAGNASNLPVHLFQGDLDPVVSAASTRAWQRRLQDAGVAADYTEFPGARHNVWDFAYKNGAIFDWFAKYRRNRFPQRVRFMTRSYEYASAYWVRIDGLTPGVVASIDASVTSPTAIKVDTQNVDAFTVTLEKVSAAPVKITIDGAPLQVKAAGALSFVRTAGRWRSGFYSAAAKGPGAEGPIVEAVSGRQIYVYGTVGAHSSEDIDERRKAAKDAAAWSTARARLSLALPVKADADVTAEDLNTADLILFGTAATNSIIARLDPKLPLSLSPGAADYGLLFIAPVGKHYALVSSGLPWWTGADETNRGGYPLAPAQYRLLSTFGDYIFFKGSLANVVAEGRFDRNWKLPSDVAQKMTATGTVSVR